MKERACKPKATVYNEEAGKLINMTHWIDKGYSTALVNESVKPACPIVMHS